MNIKYFWGGISKVKPGLLRCHGGVDTHRHRVVLLFLTLRVTDTPARHQFPAATIRHRSDERRSPKKAQHEERSRSLMPLETVTGHLALPTALLAITSEADRLARTDGGACQKLVPVYWTPPITDLFAEVSLHTPCTAPPLSL